MIHKQKKNQLEIDTEITCDKTSWHKCQNCYKYTPNISEERGKYECDKEINRIYKKDTSNISKDENICHKNYTRNY